MKVITAPESLRGTEGVSVFLAGGIQKCPEWQDECIRKLVKTKGTLFNPRRKNFPIHDPNAALEQITWEFNAMAQADIFSMWFCNADSDQPICMYELGRQLALRDPEFCVIGVEPGYKREADVQIQTELAVPRLRGPRIKISDNLDEHIENIRHAIAFCS